MTLSSRADGAGSARTLLGLVAATFLIFFQAYMVAPLIPQLARELAVTERAVALLVPAYLLPYALGSLVCGVLSDRFGRRRVLMTSLLAFGLLTGLTAVATGVTPLICIRAVTGLGAAGVIPAALTLVGELFPFRERGRPLGWIFGAMAGGMAFGSTLGSIVESTFGWRVLFVGVSAVALGLYAWMLRFSTFPSAATSAAPPLRATFAAFGGLLGSTRGRRTYGYVLLNGLFHSGTYTWLGELLQRRYQLSPVEVGLVLLGYGVPGLLLGPVVGRLADRFGRGLLLPVGFVVAGTSGLWLSVAGTPVEAALAITLLSLGYDLTQPLLAAIVTAVGGQRAGQAMGLNVFTLYVGFGLGALLFGELREVVGSEGALLGFVLLELAASVVAFRVFRDETSETAGQRPLVSAEPST